MRITIDIRLLGRGTRSGIEEYTESLVDRLIANSNHQFELFYNGLRRAPIKESWPKKSNVNVTNWHIPNKLLDLSAKFLKYPQINTDVLFSPHFNLIEGGKSPHIMTFHDLSFLHHPGFFSKKQLLWHRLQDYKRKASGAARLIAVSEFTKSDLVNILKIPEEKISVIYSGVSDDFHRLPENTPSLVAFTAEHHLNFPFILYLGTLEPRKNIPSLIRAFNLLKENPTHKELRLILAGAPGWLYQTVLREAAASRFQKDIIFWGPVKTSDRILLYNKCRVFSYPSFFEGFGFPPLEAQKCGSPVVAGNRTSIPEILGSSALLPDPWRIHDLANALQTALENETERSRLIAGGYENAKRFDWSETGKKTLEIIEKYGKRSPTP